MDISNQYISFWNNIYKRMGRTNHCAIPFSLSPIAIPELSHPLHLLYSNQIAFNYLYHHCGIHTKVIQYLINRRIIISGYIASNHIPVIAFVHRLPINKKIARYMPPVDINQKLTIYDDLKRLKTTSYVPNNNEHLIGFSYLILTPSNHSYSDIHGMRHRLLFANLTVGYQGYFRYCPYAHSCFAIRIGRQVKHIILTTTPIESICYLQLHLHQHKLLQNSLIVSLYGNIKNFKSMLRQQYINLSNINRILILPSHHLKSQQLIYQIVINNLFKNEKYIKVAYPKKPNSIYKGLSWKQMLQYQSFNNSYYSNLILSKNIDINKNLSLINLAFQKALAENDEQNFGRFLVLTSLIASSHHKIIKHSRLKTIFNKIKMTDKNISNYGKRLIIKYMSSIGYLYSPNKLFHVFSFQYQRLHRKAISKNNLLHSMRNDTKNLMHSIKSLSDTHHVHINHNQATILYYQNKVHPQQHKHYPNHKYKQQHKRVRKYHEHLER